MSIFNRKKVKAENEAAQQIKHTIKSDSSPAFTPLTEKESFDSFGASQHNIPTSHKNETRDTVEQSSRNMFTADSIHSKGDQTGDGQRRPYVYWPKYGEALKTLFGKKGFRVFVDISFIRSKEFVAFAKQWAELKADTPYAYYVFSFEIDHLTNEERALLNSCCSRTFKCTSAADCFQQITNKNMGWSILLLTADEQTGTNLQKSASENRVWLRYYRMNEHLELCSFQKLQPQNPLETKPYNPTAELAEVSRSASPVNRVPSTGDTVSAINCGLHIRLGKPVMSDHSSITYATSDPNLFAKIYTAQALSIDMFENKADRMLRDPVSIEGVCWPKDKLSNTQGLFVGILIPSASGVQLSKSVLGGQAGLMRYFPNWNKIDLCSLSETILEVVCKLHRLGVFIGCLNPAAIYVSDSKHVSFVDTDSWQIEGYPVLSRNLTHTPPELLGKDQSGYLYNLDEERYQIILLTFMIMMPGKFPYAKKRGASVEDGIRDASFPFGLGKKMSRAEDSERPGGVWQMVWDNISYDLCRGFYNTFSKNGFNYLPGKRLSEMLLLNQVREYKKSLLSGENGLSTDLFPRTFRRDGKHPFYRCQYCGQEHPEFYFLHTLRINNNRVNIWDRGIRICLPCTLLESSDPSATFRCQSCGRELTYSNRAKIMHDVGSNEFNRAAQKWCGDCKRHTIECSRCHRAIPFYQIKEFVDRRHNLTYKVCKDCFGTLIDEAKRTRRY